MNLKEKVKSFPAWFKKTPKKNKLKVIDATAISLCMDNNLPIIVFSIKKKGNLKRAIEGKKIGTTIS